MQFGKVLYCLPQNGKTNRLFKIYLKIDFNLFQQGSAKLEKHIVSISLYKSFGRIKKIYYYELEQLDFILKQRSKIMKLKNK